MRTAQELLNRREQTLWSVSPDASVYEALEILASHDVGALMVLDHGKVAGVVSERDYTRKVALAGRASKDTKVRDIMTTTVTSVTPQTRTEDCMALMRQKKFRHLPVIDGGRVIGMLSIRDIMDDIIDNHELTISQLQSYIVS